MGHLDPAGLARPDGCDAVTTEFAKRVSDTGGKMRVMTAEGYSPPAHIAGIINGMFTQPASAYGPSMLVDMEEGRTTEGGPTIGDLADRAAQRASPHLCSPRRVATFKPTKSIAPQSL